MKYCWALQTASDKLRLLSSITRVPGPFYLTHQNLKLTLFLTSLTDTTRVLSEPHASFRSALRRWRRNRIALRPKSNLEHVKHVGGFCLLLPSISPLFCIIAHHLLYAVFVGSREEYFLDGVLTVLWLLAERRGKGAIIKHSILR